MEQYAEIIGEITCMWFLHILHYNRANNDESIGTSFSALKNAGQWLNDFNDFMSLLGQRNNCFQLPV